ncbi:MAG: tRNA threonylcarbamoyladenosine dehydratase [Verrucomicrobiota bacterium]
MQPSILNPSRPIDTERFGGLGRLYGRAALERLARAHVAVIGVGGVGSWTAEALARSGVGRLTLIDMDDVCITNTNRQLPALEGEIGRPKVEVLAERIRRINPGCAVEAVTKFFLESTADRLLCPACQPFDWVVDAVDRMSIKALLITKARALDISVLTVGGAGGRRDATQVRCGDLGATGGDALLRQVRRELRHTHGWAVGRGAAFNVPAVYSAEPQVFPQSDGTVCATKEAGENLRMDCASGYGAACFVTGAFGFAAAGEVVRRIAEK